jgi:hypothetical protein
MKSYFVYKISFDFCDFDTCPQVYFLGLYKDKSKAYEICTKDICKNTFCKEIDTNKECYIQL